MSAVLDRLAPAPDPLAPDATQRAQFARDVLDGLARPHKGIPCTWLYDHRGSQLFEQIT